MIQRWPWFDFLSRQEAGAVGAAEAEIRWLKRSIDKALGPENTAKRRRHRYDIAAMKMLRQSIVNRGTQRARLAHKRRTNQPTTTARRAA